MDKKLSNIFEPGTKTIFVFLVLFTLTSLFLNQYVFWVEAVVVAALYLFYLRTRMKHRQGLARHIEQLSYQVDSAAKSSLLSFPLPLVVVHLNGNISWYNESFFAILNKEDYMLEKPITDIFPQLDYAAIIEETIQNPITVKLENRIFDIYANAINVKNASSGFAVLYLIEQTQLETTKHELQSQRSVAGILMIDNYEDIMQNAKELEKANVTTRIDKRVSTWAENNGALLQKFARDKYLFVMEQQYLKNMIAERFPILDQVKEILVGPHKMPATISLGIGRDGGSFMEKFDFARAAMDVALGRGGDQVVIKDVNNFEFFGGKSKEMEKRTKVKSRVAATALKELISDAEQVYIMGHRYADLDAVGAAIGVYRIVVGMGKRGNILLSTRSTEVERLIENVQELEEYSDVFVSPASLLLPPDKKTLLIVVDTNNPDYVESSEVLDTCNNVVVIDHHRRVGNYIEKTALNFHEPFSSSACEMVTELLQYLEDIKIKKEEANALLAGIVLDTKNFTQRTGVRTFEAASYLKRCGADPAETKALFTSDLQSFRLKMRFISQANMPYPHVALSVWRDDSTDFSKELFAQSIDEMLSITGVHASFGIIRFEDEVHISARSNGEINVQIIMEKLGGGGHQTMAGVQLRNTSLDAALEALIAIIEDTVTEVAQEE